MLRPITLSLGAALALSVSLAASAATVKPAAKPAAKASAKSTPSKSASAARAGTAAAAAGAAAAALSPGQLDAAQRVYTGSAACEFGEQVNIAAVDGKPGHFTLQHKASNYQLVPEETTTGAVRLEDKRAGIVWLQIPSKSMLMNSRIGQRLVDNCTMAQQKG